MFHSGLNFKVIVENMLDHDKLAVSIESVLEKVKGGYVRVAIALDWSTSDSIGTFTRWSIFVVCFAVISKFATNIIRIDVMQQMQQSIDTFETINDRGLGNRYLSVYSFRLE